MKTKRLFKTLLSGLTVVCMAASVPVYAADSSDTDLKTKYADLAGKTLKVGTGCAQAGWTMDDGTGNPEGMVSLIPSQTLQPSTMTDLVFTGSQIHMPGNLTPSFPEKQMVFRKMEI